MRSFKPYVSHSLLALWILAFGALPTLLYADKDVGKDVHCLYAQTFGFGYCGSWSGYSPTTSSDDSGNFYAQNISTYAAGDSNFTANYKNGTLIFGNDKKEQGTQGVHFGSGGFTGYVNGTWNTKEAYLTGHLGAGNNTGAGAGATLTFNTTENITAQGLNLDMWSNTTGDTLTLNAQGDVAINSSTFKIKGSNSNLNITAKGSLNADSFTLNMPTNTEKVVANFSGDSIEFKNSNLNIAGPDIAWNKNEANFRTNSSLSFSDTTT